MGLVMVNQKLAILGEFLVKWGGTMLVSFVLMSTYYSCVHIIAENMYDNPTLIYWLTLIARVIILEIIVNLACFVYYARYNSVTYWHRKSCVADLRVYAEDNEAQPEVEYASAQPRVDRHLSWEPANEAGSKFCFTCNKEAPQRSHHCPLCKMCVLRKDHHCFITGACVGLGNQRYFMVFLFWCAIGLVIAMPHLFFYMNTEIAYCIANKQTPTWFTGIIYDFQVYYTTQGYTMYEYNNLTVRATFQGDGENMGERLRLVFGKNWALNFLVPLPWNLPVLTPAISDSLFRVRSKVL
ncbi:Protein CBG14526 [Caenorhabditis briggsae]|uniref:Palmitoyltransferase n=1 Tax=Caenorhabditis briggsae TaxID=6238 RepID=A8XK44_CAEBR|nr:Protein CBG14526 [Caenorhabditis briggsae]CAP33020.2 Protein CBG14526 [Caenorhabditis briggsae]